MPKEKDKKQIRSAEETEMLPEYDFENMKLQRGRTLKRLRQLTAARTLSPDLAERFPDDESVNKALEEFLRMKDRESA